MVVVEQVDANQVADGVKEYPQIWKFREKAVGQNEGHTDKQVCDASVILKLPIFLRQYARPKIVGQSQHTGDLGRNEDEPQGPRSCLPRIPGKRGVLSWL